ncbi:hotdog fold thioesterase [Rubrobacter calidifluminis]|uniref:hotdog fold thioesterase n=1 Tax=Rubrobacter calidifluminis TaxID=1392640 RepID=UPI003B5C0676
MEALGIEIEEVCARRVVAKMPVHGPTRQTFGLLHGGASAALAETVASLGTYDMVDKERQSVVGTEVTASHLRPKGRGTVRALGQPIHRGDREVLWDVRITDERGRLVCSARCTVAVVPRYGIE